MNKLLMLIIGLLICSASWATNVLESPGSFTFNTNVKNLPSTYGGSARFYVSAKVPQGAGFELVVDSSGDSVVATVTKPFGDLEGKAVDIQVEPIDYGLPNEIYQCTSDDYIDLSKYHSVIVTLDYDAYNLGRYTCSYTAN